MCVCVSKSNWVSKWSHVWFVCWLHLSGENSPCFNQKLGINTPFSWTCVCACVRACMRVCVYVCVCLKGNLDHRVHSRWGGTVFEENLLWTYLFSAVCSGCLCVFLSACYGPPECVFVCALSMRDTVAEVITWTVCSTDFLSVYFAAISQHGSMCLRLCCTGVTFHRV